MIVVMEPGATDEQVEATVKRVESMGLKANVIVGTERTVVAAIGALRLSSPDPARRREIEQRIPNLTAAIVFFQNNNQFKRIMICCFHHY